MRKIVKVGLFEGVWGAIWGVALLMLGFSPLVSLLAMGVAYSIGLVGIYLAGWFKSPGERDVAEQDGVDVLVEQLKALVPIIERLKRDYQPHTLNMSIISRRIMSPGAFTADATTLVATLDALGVRSPDDDDWVGTAPPMAGLLRLVCAIPPTEPDVRLSPHPALRQMG